MQEVRVSKQMSEIAGRCNGCTDHELYSNYFVWVIDLRTISIRVCRKCCVELIKQVKEDTP